jgi:hypothetical protein
MNVGFFKRFFNMVTTISNQEIIKFLNGKKQELADLLNGIVREELDGIVEEEQSLDQSQWRAISRGLRNAPEYQGAVDLTRSLRNEEDKLKRDLSLATRPNSRMERADIGRRMLEFNRNLHDDSQNPTVKIFFLLKQLDSLNESIGEAQIRATFKVNEVSFEEWMKKRPPSPLEISQKIADLVLESCGNALQGLRGFLSGVMHNNNPRQ